MHKQLNTVEAQARHADFDALSEVNATLFRHARIFIEACAISKDGATSIVVLVQSMTRDVYDVREIDCKDLRVIEAYECADVRELRYLLSMLADRYMYDALDVTP